MVLQCCICKKTKFLYPDLTFHTFPTNIDDRAIWLSNLGEEKRISKNSRICSAHFSQEDFEIKPSGRKFLKIGAIPASVVDPESMPGPKTIQNPKAQYLEDYWIEEGQLPKLKHADILKFLR